MKKALGIGIKSVLFLSGFSVGIELVRDEMVKLNNSYDEYKEVFKYKPLFNSPIQSENKVVEKSDVDKSIIIDLLGFRDRTLDKLKSNYN